MNNERVIAVTTIGDTVFGITDMGRPVQFDKSIQQFVARGPIEILDMDRANVLKKTDTSSLDFKHRGRYRSSDELPEAIKPSRIKTMMTPVNIAIGLLGLIILMYFFIR